MYVFSRFYGIPYAIHHLLQCLQFSRTQATIKQIEVDLDGKKEVLVTNRSYCSGVKVCAHEGCAYTVSTKQKISRCKEHPSMGLRVTGPCSRHITSRLMIVSRKAKKQAVWDK